jgi:lipopolysaccharide transport system ATP-binding protein
MSEVVIRVENVTKTYRLGVINHGTLQNDLQSWWAQLRGREDPNRLVDIYSEEKTRLKGDFFYALDNISFEIKRGEKVGIIGRNGAGKSTILKIISRVTTPSEGRVRINGRIASLLEVGTGFHPELTGRENIYLNGAILGMTKSEITEKFDEIVDFAEIREFIDTPVKRYSSGMYVRLAFAVAAHLDPEILILDEVLAVGDTAFQKKCLGKMGNISKEGKTILFVSHNLAAIKQLCPRALFIRDGKIVADGPSENIIDEYLLQSGSVDGITEASFDEDPEKEVQLLKIRVLSGEGRVRYKFSCDEPIILELEMQFRKKIPGLYGYLTISRSDGTLVLQSDSFDTPPNPLDDVEVGRHIFMITIPARSLAPNKYTVYLNFTSNQARSWNVDSPKTVCSFELEDYTSQRGNNRHGFFSTMLEWKKI